MEAISTSALEGTLLCPACRAGSLFSFNWHYYGEEGTPEQRRQYEALEPWQDLRRGALWRCRDCRRPWHLDGAEGMMTIVPEGRLALILEWNRSEIMLSEAVLAALGEIGPTPPDIYGNNSEYVQIPCGVVTRAGEHVDAAIVSLQQDAPVEAWRPSRLASEIAEVYPSPNALPLEIRLASTRAEEVHMGLAPSSIVMPDGRRFMLNWTTHFFSEPGYRAADARIDPGAVDLDALPPLAASPAVTYFVADG